MVSRAGLTRGRIVRHALEVADAEGLAAVSFRRLATDLGVTPMALYRHVEDRDDLLAAMADLVVEEISLPETDLAPGGDCTGALRGLMTSAVAVYARHPAARELSSAPRLGPRSADLTESVIRLLATTGFSEREALVILQRLSDAALADSWTGLDPSLPGPPGLTAALRQTEPSDPRAFGLEVVIAGVESLAAQRRGG